MLSAQSTAHRNAHDTERGPHGARAEGTTERDTQTRVTGRCSGCSGGRHGPARPAGPPHATVPGRPVALLPWGPPLQQQPGPAQARQPLGPPPPPPAARSSPLLPAPPARSPSPAARVRPASPGFTAALPRGLRGPGARRLASAARRRGAAPPAGARRLPEAGSSARRLRPFPPFLFCPRRAPQPQTSGGASASGRLRGLGKGWQRRGAAAARGPCCRPCRGAGWLCRVSCRAAPRCRLPSLPPLGHLTPALLRSLVPSRCSFTV